MNIARGIVLSIQGKKEADQLCGCPVTGQLICTLGFAISQIHVAGFLLPCVVSTCKGSFLPKQNFVMTKPSLLFEPL